MPRNVIRPSTETAIPAALRRRFTKVDRDPAVAAARKERTRKLKALSADYRRDLLGLLGREGMKEFNALKKRLKDSPRSTRRRATEALLSRIGFDRQRAKQLRDTHAAALSKEFEDWWPSFPIRIGLPRCSPVVEYRAPFPAEFVDDLVAKSGDVGNPAFSPYVNKTTGEIGSRVRARVSGAGDDDGVNSDYYTAFRRFHTTLATGALEVSVDLEIQAQRIWGKVTDEWGWSAAQYRQTASAWIRVITVSQPDESQSSIIINHQGVSWGDDKVWDTAGNSGDAHTFRFRTTGSYPQGTFVILETGVRNEAWFEANDMSIDMTADVHLTIDRIRVRSCP